MHTQYANITTYPGWTQSFQKPYLAPLGQKGFNYSITPHHTHITEYASLKFCPPQSLDHNYDTHTHTLQAKTSVLRALLTLQSFLL